MRIARLCYSIYKDGSSNRSLGEILKVALNGVDVGDINHSKAFPVKYRPFVAAEITQNLLKFLSTRMEQAGFKPPINVQADKGTNCLRTRQFTSSITIVPGSPALLTSIYLGQPVVKQHDGKGITESIVWTVETLEYWWKPDWRWEFRRTVFSSQCPGTDVWDPLRKGGLVDTHIRADDS